MSLTKVKAEWKPQRYEFRNQEILELFNYYKSYVKNEESTNKHILEQWMVVKSYLLNTCDKTSNIEIYRDINRLELAPILIKIIQFHFALPVSNASVERCFSYMNLIKTLKRNSMNDDLLDSSLAIKYNGTEPKDTPFDDKLFFDAEEYWKKQKKRRYAQ